MDLKKAVPTGLQKLVRKGSKKQIGKMLVK